MSLIIRAFAQREQAAAGVTIGPRA